MRHTAAASVIHHQLPFPPSEIDAVLAQLGPCDESDNGIALFDFFSVRDELRRRHGIDASAPDDCDASDECVYYSSPEDDDDDD